jgi:hypothetical protein
MERVLHAFLSDPRYDPTHGTQSVDPRLLQLARSRDLSEKSIAAIMNHPRVESLRFLACCISDAWDQNFASELVTRAMKDVQASAKRTVFLDFVLLCVGMGQHYRNDVVVAQLISERLGDMAVPCPGWENVLRLASFSERLYTTKVVWSLVPETSQVPLRAFERAIHTRSWRTTRLLAEMWNRTSGFVELLRALCTPEGHESLERLLSRQELVALALPDYEALARCAETQTHVCARLLLRTASDVGKPYSFEQAQSAFQEKLFSGRRKRPSTTSRWLVNEVLEALRLENPDHPVEKLAPKSRPPPRQKPPRVSKRTKCK